MNRKKLDKFIFAAANAFVLGYIIPCKALGCLVAILTFAFIIDLCDSCEKMMREDDTEWL